MFRGRESLVFFLELDDDLHVEALFRFLARFVVGIFDVHAGVLAQSLDKAPLQIYQRHRIAGFVQHQQITGLRQRRRKVFVLQSAGSGLFGFVHLKNKFLPGLTPVDGGTQLFQQRHLAAFAAFEELQDHHPLSAAHGPQSKAHGSGGLALAITVI